MWPRGWVEVQLYSSTSAALEVGECSAGHSGRTLPLGKEWYPFYRGLGGPQGRSGRAKNLVPTGIPSRTVQPVAQSLYRLSYRAHNILQGSLYLLYVCSWDCWVGWDSSVGIATRYGLDGPGTEFRCEGEILWTRPDLPWYPSSFLYNDYRVFPGVKAAEAWRWPPTQSNAEVKERVKLYLYSSSGPSWSVIG